MKLARSFAVLALLGLAPVGAGAQCPGDLDENGRVSLDEIVHCVGAALSVDEGPAARCEVNGEPGVQIDDLVAAVASALDGCAATPTPTPTRLPTSTSTSTETPTATRSPSPTVTATPTPTEGSDCCIAHAGPACDDATCASCVCRIDPLCCAESAGWDQFCVGHTRDSKECAVDCSCVATTPTPGGDCCTAHAGAGCEKAPCRECVCGVDATCCSEEWDAACAVIAGDECGPTCACVPTLTPTPTPTPGGDCCSAHTGTECDDAACEECVCGLDATCCSLVWDGRCADEAAEECRTACACPADCCGTHDEVGCGDARCQDCVCATDPSCCAEVWDQQCVSEAGDECAVDCPCEAAGDCCAAHEGVGCAATECQDCVCGLDSVCCTGDWDGRCVEEASVECAPSCPCDGAPCCTAHPGLGCGVDGCENCVCDLDEICCTDGWDGRCADEAADECAGFCSCTGADDCCIAREEPGCGDPACATCVCDTDAVCCGEIWDETCVDIAATKCTGVCSCLPEADCCERGREDPGCGDAECASCVCAIDSVCCFDVWDDTCVDIAFGEDECGAACSCSEPTVTPTSSPPPSPSPSTPTPTTGPGKVGVEL